MSSLSRMDRINKFVLTSVLLCIIFHISTTSATDNKESPPAERSSSEAMCKLRRCVTKCGSRECRTYNVKCRFGCCGGVGEERCCTRAEASKKQMVDIALDCFKEIVYTFMFVLIFGSIIGFLLGVLIAYLTSPPSVSPVAAVQANDKLLRRRTSVGSRYFPWKAAGDNTAFN